PLMDIHRRPLRIVWAGGLALLVFTTAGAGWLLHPPWSNEAAALPPNLEQEIVCFGHVDVESGISALSPTQPGGVVRIEVREGQVAEAGDVLLRLDDSAARLRVAEAQAALRAAEAQHAEAKQLAEQQQAKIDQQHAAVEIARSRLAVARH